MESGFNVFRRLDDGQELHVAWRRDVEAAEHLVADLNDTWPGEYGYREANSQPPPAAGSLSRRVTQRSFSRVQLKYSY